MIKRIENTYPLFWLINNDIYKDLLNNGAIYLEGAEPLFASQPFYDLIDVSPWVIPITDNHTHLDESLLSKGILFESPSHQTLIAHFRSLLLAGYQGESVMFRFYDPHIFNSVYQNGTLDRRSLFLGAAHRVHMKINGEHIRLDNPYPDRFLLQKAPWWIIGDDDFSDLYNIDNHAYCVSRRLWQVLPELMEKLTKAESDLTVLFHHGSHLVQKKSIEYWVIAALIHQTHISLSHVVERLHLDIEEQQKLQHWLGKIS
ncbi:DUF4123 domain-containing protein [Photobacterium kishitanii]|uniref:DUF4123 domain-containing protein n=1 Tax=Photobacterium kishitanii TaxID=318456 RepID=UPI0007F8702E|nr:DUF4123 domain-containing protein [Photobacterium kishitanii]OBU28675.1 hypothetical protein AYY23_22705 [Photobacterium kishitanii]PSU87345.1 DUF4123 domain-containing protein [Photobacterium kishitanii]PSW46969.1 DUF4123 domain-containing protein [Photobacterium kishitanii]